MWQYYCDIQQWHEDKARSSVTRFTDCRLLRGPRGTWGNRPDGILSEDCAALVSNAAHSLTRNVRGMDTKRSGHYTTYGILYYMAELKHLHSKRYKTEYKLTSVLLCLPVLNAECTVDLVGYTEIKHCRGWVAGLLLGFSDSASPSLPPTLHLQPLPRPPYHSFHHAPPRGYV
jgi:hypothetical protein